MGRSHTRCAARCCAALVKRFLQRVCKRHRPINVFLVNCRYPSSTGCRLTGVINNDLGGTDYHDCTCLPLTITIYLTIWLNFIKTKMFILHAPSKQRLLTIRYDSLLAAPPQDTRPCISRFALGPGFVCRKVMTSAMLTQRSCCLQQRLSAAGPCIGSELAGTLLCGL